MKYSTDRIVGGKPAQSMIPWQVYLPFNTINGCGGTIIDRCTVLSAAHCGIKVGQLIRAGTRFKNKNLVTRYVSKVITDENYYNGFNDGYLLYHDFAILKLNKKLPKNNPYIKPACLPSLTSWGSSKMNRCFVSGWGLMGMLITSPL